MVRLSPSFIYVLHWNKYCSCFIINNSDEIIQILNFTWTSLWFLLKNTVTSHTKSCHLRASNVRSFRNTSIVFTTQHYKEKTKVWSKHLTSLSKKHKSLKKKEKKKTNLLQKQKNTLNEKKGVSGRVSFPSLPSRKQK